MSRFVAIAVVVLALAGCSEGGQAIERDPASVAAGADLFQVNCAECHGTDLDGTDAGPPLLHRYYAPNHHADEAFQRAVLVGVVPHHWEFGPMEPVEGLDRDDVALIIDFVRSEQEAAGIFRDPTLP